MIYADTGSHGISITNLLWLMAQNWREEKGKVRTSLRVTLFLGLLQALQEKLAKFVSQEGAVKQGERLEWLTIGGQPLDPLWHYHTWSQEEKKFQKSGGPHPAQQDYDGDQHLKNVADEVSFDAAFDREAAGGASIALPYESEPADRYSISMPRCNADEAASGTGPGADLQELQFLRLGPGTKEPSNGISSGEGEGERQGRA